MPYRLGMDLGTNSLGWCAVQLDKSGRPCRFLDMGARIFSDGRDPKSKQSLAADRRAARAMRRGQDRYKQRRDSVIRHLARLNLFPDDTDAAERRRLQGLDPFALRARALDEPIAAHEVGRALFHISQRRGFKSNRKADRASNESGKIRTGVARLQAEMERTGSRTFGEFLHKRRALATDANRIPSVRTRLRPESGEGARGDGYDFYPDRALLEQEFHAILNAQAAHHPRILTAEARRVLFEVIFHQRPLKPAQVGLCTLLFETGELRLPKAHPLFQKRRLLEELNHLELVRAGVSSSRLTREQRDVLYLKLKTKREVAFETLRTKVLKLDPTCRFNKESEHRPGLKGDEVAAVMGARGRFGTRWVNLSIDAQWEIVRQVRDAETAEDVEKLAAWLRATHGVTDTEARSIIDAPLPEGYGRFGETATRRLVDALWNGTAGITLPTYSQAVEIANLGHHSDRRTGEVFDQLPYYAAVLQSMVKPGSGDPSERDEVLRFGRMTNPTVHIGLNQMRHVVNRLTRRHGKPAEIVLEIARELKLNDEEKERRKRENTRNRLDAEKRSIKLRDLGIPDKGSNRNILKLWEELNPHDALDRRCIYTGARIGIETLFSGAVEVDHILPFDRTLDDSQGNRILCMREANRAKRMRSPFEAFGHAPQWAEIAARAACLPRAKQWRFEPDAMARFEGERDFLARHLVDTQHLAKVAAQYLGCLYSERGHGSSHVWVTPGRLTEMLRRSWGLNVLLPDHNYAGGTDQEKNRLDHRHHTIDAAVVAVTDRALLQRIAHEAGARSHEDALHLARRSALPWEDFTRDLGERLLKVVVSHRPDHGSVSKGALPKGRDRTAGRLHNDTAYGLTGRTERGLDLVVHRVPLESLKPDDLEDGGRRVADVRLRQRLKEIASGRSDKAFVQALRDFAAHDPIHAGMRRVRVVEPLSVIRIRDSGGCAYKTYKGDSNFRYEVWELADGRWIENVVTMFEIHQPGWVSEIRRKHHNPTKVLSLHRDDVVGVERDHGRELLRVVKFTEGQIVFAPPNEGGSLKKRDAEKGDPFKYVLASASTLRRWCARQVRVDELGRVQDPGPRRDARAD